jgi:cytochrome P450
MTISEAIDSLPLPPGSFGLPLIGETLSFFNDPQFAQKRHQRYGDVFKSSLFGKPTVFVRGSEAIRFVLSHENQYFAVSWPASTKALLGSLSLSLLQGSAHASRRKLLAQAFMPRALSGYIQTMEETMQAYCHRWQQMGTFTWYPELRNYTLDVACKLLVGVDSASKTPLGYAFETWGAGLFSLPIPLPWTVFGQAKRARQQLLQQIETIVLQRQTSHQPGNDALGLLLQARDENGEGLSLAELKDQILTLLFAGHETLTSAIASFCLLTAQHPDVLSKLRAEQQQWLAEEPLTLEQLKQMSYLEQVLKEVLRLIPPVGGGFRQVLQSCDINGYRIPRHWSILYQIGATHHSSQVYEQPERFDPDRFHLEPSGQASKSIDQQKYGYIPFGGGIRECLGKEFARLEMKIFAVHLLRYYEWSLLPDQDLEMVAVPTPHPQDGLKVHFQKYSK